MRPYLFRLPEFLGRVPDWVPFVGGTRLGGRPIFSYGVMLAVSVLLGWLLASFFIEKFRIDRRKTNIIFVCVVIGGLIGARLLYFIASAPDQFSLATFIRFQEGGLVAYGAFLGGILAGIFPALALKGDYWGTADAVAPVLCLGTGITRIGCFLYGCDFGRVTTGAWAVRFPRWVNPAVVPWIPSGAPAFNQHFHDGLVGGADPFSNSVYPTQLLMSLYGLLGFVLLMLAIPYRKFRGQIMLLFLIYEGLMRFLVEFLRGDKIRGTQTFGLPLSTSQFISVGVVLLAIPLYAWFRRVKKLC